MKFTADELFEMAVKVYRTHGIEITISAREGIGAWAAESADDTYGSERDVISELESYDECCPECGEYVKMKSIVDGVCPECR